MDRRALRIALTFAALLMAPASANAFVYTVAGNGDQDSRTPGDGLPATDAHLSFVRHVAYEADGSILISDFAAVRVRRVGSDGRISTVAGPGGAIPPRGSAPDPNTAIDPGGMAPLGDLSFLLALGDGRVQRIARDGSQTTLVKGLTGASDVALLPDGGFLVAVPLSNSIVRVYPDGHSETVAGSGPFGRKENNFGGDGGPATQAKLMLPEAVAPTPDGGFVIADTENWRVRKVGPDGVITTIAGNGLHETGAVDGMPATSVPIGPVHDVALRPDGTLLIAAGNVLELKPDGTLAVVYPKYADGIEPMPDGGLLVTQQSRVLYLAPDQPQRLAVAMHPLPTSSAKPLVARFRSTLPAAAGVNLVRAGSVRASASGDAVAGENAIPVQARLARGAIYRLELTATSPQGFVVTDRIGIITAPLPLKAARWITQTTLHGDAGYGEDVAACRRVSSVRVDCRVRSADTVEGVTNCNRMTAVTLRGDGRLRWHMYRCPFRKKPRQFLGPAQIVDAPTGPPSPF